MYKIILFSYLLFIFLKKLPNLNYGSEKATTTAVWKSYGEGVVEESVVYEVVVGPTIFFIFKKSNCSFPATIASS